MFASQVKWKWWALLSGIALLIAVFPVAHARSKRPIVAVFTIQDKTGQLTPEMIQQLTDYLRARVAGGGSFQVIPSSQLKQRLSQQKTESYKACYDEQCQIEIGRELAANKSLATQIVKVGTMCAVMSTLYDLKKAITDHSSTQKSGCRQDELVSAVEKVVASMDRKFRPRETKIEKPRPATMGTLRFDVKPDGATVLVDGVIRGRAPLMAAIELTPGKHVVRVELSGHQTWERKIDIHRGKEATARVELKKTVFVEVRVDTEPRGATVYLDKDLRGQTPLSLSLPARSDYQLQVKRPGYQEVNETLTLQDSKELSYSLRMTDEASRTRTEWISLELGSAYGEGPNGGFLGMGLGLQFFTLKWKYLFWTVVDMAGGLAPGGERAFGFFNTRAGFPLYFGKRNQHQLRLGLGLGWALYSLSDEVEFKYSDGIAPVTSSANVSPSIHYLYQFSGMYFIGLGIRAQIPMYCADPEPCPTAFWGSIPMGWAALP